LSPAFEAFRTPGHNERKSRVSGAHSGVIGETCRVDQPPRRIARV